MTYREIIYMVLDEVRLVTDDITLNEEHVLFLMENYRASLLEQKYKTVKTEVSDSNYQQICLQLEEVNLTEGFSCDMSYLRTTEKIPKYLNIGTPVVTPKDMFRGLRISLISWERMRYIGFNKFLRNIIYCAIAPDNYLYFSSANPQFKYLENVTMTAVFEDTIQAGDLACETVCDLLDREFPIDRALCPVLVQTIANELLYAKYNPKDMDNDTVDESEIPDAKLLKKLEKKKKQQQK